MDNPEYVDWAITNSCNLDCNHCVGMEREELDNENAVRLAESIVDLSPNWVILEGGEPLLRKDLGEVGKILQEGGLKVFLITNGISFTSESFSRIKSFSPEIIFSIDSLDSETYEKIKGGGDLETSLEWVEKCSEENMFQGLTVVLSKLNLDQSRDFVRMVENFEGESVYFLPLKPSGSDKASRQFYKKYALSAEEHEKAIKELYTMDTSVQIFYDEPFLWNFASKHDLSINKEEVELRFLA